MEIVADRACVLDVHKETAVGCQNVQAISERLL